MPTPSRTPRPAGEGFERESCSADRFRVGPTWRWRSDAPRAPRKRFFGAMRAGAWSMAARCTCSATCPRASMRSSPTTVLERRRVPRPAWGTTAKYVSTNSANKEIPAFEGDVRDQRSFTLWTALWSARRGAPASMAAISSRSPTGASSLPSATPFRPANGCGGICAWDKTEASRPRNGVRRAVRVHGLGDARPFPKPASISTAASACSPIATSSTKADRSRSWSGS